ncbi:MAG: two-component system OmpR family response regulator [Rhodobacteraceae bacterium]|nr:MAG: two-component system OmpR family response regulator [Paracoccaceae bacterium]
MLIVFKFELKYLQGGRIDLDIHAATLGIKAVDFIAPIVDLDACHFPALRLGHLAHGLARLPVRHWHRATIILCKSGTSQTKRDDKSGGGEDKMDHRHFCVLREVLLGGMTEFPDSRLKQTRPKRQAGVSLNHDHPVSSPATTSDTMMRVLLIEDDTVLGAAVRDQISADGHSIDWVTRLDAAADHLKSVGYDLILLDLMLPDGRGQPFLRKLRLGGDVTPVIILSALDQISDRIDGLNAGADDYMIKPFDLSELTARLNAVARRYSGNPNPIISFRDLEVDLAARSVHRAGKPLALTAREWVLFEAFLQRPGQLLSKAQLEDRLYAFDTEIDSNTIEVHVSRLRKKLGHDVIETSRGLGYRLGAA